MSKTQVNAKVNAKVNANDKVKYISATPRNLGSKLVGYVFLENIFI